jgi:hypothetical protein
VNSDVLKTRVDFGAFMDELGIMGPAAEVGVAEGQYSLSILQWGVPHLYMIDLWGFVPGRTGDLGFPQDEHDQRYRDAKERVAKFGDRVTIIRDWSVTAAAKIPDGSLAFVHLDATHERHEVLRDLDAWWPKLRPGGIMSGHDYLAKEYTVKAGADEFAKSHGAEIRVLDEARPEHACFWFFKE